MMLTEHDIKKLVRKNFNESLEEFIREDIEEEGLSDVGDKLKDIFNFKNDKRDEFIRNNNRQNIGPKRKGSKTVSFLNGLGWTLDKLFNGIELGKKKRADKWDFKKTEHEHGGYFAKDIDYDHLRDKNKLEDEIQATINKMGTFIAAIHQLTYVCMPSKLTMASVPHNTGVVNCLQFLNPLNPTEYGGNLQNGLIGDNVSAINGVAINFLNRYVSTTEHLEKGKQYEWMGQYFDMYSQNINIDSNTVNGIITDAMEYLNSLDRRINRMIIFKKYTSIDQILNDEEIFYLLEGKVNCVNNKINEIVSQFAPKTKTLHVTMENGEDALPWFVHLDALYNDLARLPKKNLNQFIQQL